MSLRPSERTEARRSRYKIAVDADEGRRIREDNLVEIRKSRREESLQKKRRQSANNNAAAPLGVSSAERKENSSIVHCFPNLVSSLYSEDLNALLEATSRFRKLLSIERNPPIEQVIQSGVLPRIVEFLGFDHLPQLQFEAAWALTNIASGTSENTKALIENGAVPLLVKLLSSPSDDVRGQAAWALGNISGDSTSFRDLVLSHGALMALLAQFNDSAKISMLRNFTWTLSNFCRGKPQPPFEKIKWALPTLECLLQSTDEEIVTDACWALSYISDGSNERIQAVIEAGVCRMLVELLLHPSPTVIVPALRTIGNIATGDNVQTQCIIDHQALPRLLILLTNVYKKSIKKEALWTISNITAGTREQIQAVFSAGLIGPLVNLLNHGEFDIKKEAAWAISNATSGGSIDQIKILVQAGCIKPMCDLLVCHDPKIIMVCLEGLGNILQVGEAEKNVGSTGDVNIFAQMIEDAEGVEKIENLQSHGNHDIYETAVKMLETFWVEEGDETSIAAEQNGSHFGDNAAPLVPPGGFKFL